MSKIKQLKKAKMALAAMIMGLSATGASNAATIVVNADITTSTTFTANNVYDLQAEIHVMPGATLTIDPGTVIASSSTNGGIAITRGAKIFVNGTATQPVIFTSTADTATWTGAVQANGLKDPKTGTWRASTSEWNNLTLMGNALISASSSGANGANPVTYQDGAADSVHTNASTPGATVANPGGQKKAMEGLVAGFVGDPKVLYGGIDDADDSGSLHYVSIRYAGRVVSLGNELNGLSMGGIGRETDVDHVDIMNSVDDGIETWGGTVNYKYLHIWNAGDDSFDVDEGWRGKAQFGLMVLGYCADAIRGSGVSDNGFEFDGAENSDAQPVTTTTIYNFTYIGQPLLSARGGVTAWRDNARVQYRNCIFMDCGQKLIKFDNSDGDQAHGYGFNGTLSWEQTWTTSFTATSTVNPGTLSPAALYTAQTSGNLAEITDSVFFRNLNAAAYAESDDIGGASHSLPTGVHVTVSGGDSPTLHNVVPAAANGADDTNLPIQLLTRGAVVPLQSNSLLVLPVATLDPRAAHDAVSSFASAPQDGFFTPAPFRGAFSKDRNWAKGWTAADAYGFYPNADTVADPVATIDLTARVSYPTLAGVVYTVESSTDGKNWTPVQTVVGDGTTKSFADLAGFSTAKLYRAIVQ